MSHDAGLLFVPGHDGRRPEAHLQELKKAQAHPKAPPRRQPRPPTPRPHVPFLLLYGGDRHHLVSLAPSAMAASVCAPPPLVLPLLLLKSGRAPRLSPCSMPLSLPPLPVPLQSSSPSVSLHTASGIACHGRPRGVGGGRNLRRATVWEEATALAGAPVHYSRAEGPWAAGTVGRACRLVAREEAVTI